MADGLAAYRNRINCVNNDGQVNWAKMWSLLRLWGRKMAEGKWEREKEGKREREREREGKEGEEIRNMKTTWSVVSIDLHQYYFPVLIFFQFHSFPLLINRSIDQSISQSRIHLGWQSICTRGSEVVTTLVLRTVKSKLNFAWKW